MRAIGDATLLEIASALLRPGGEFACEVLLEKETADRHCKLGSETTILHINGDGYLRVVHWGEAHEYGVVLTSVLGCTCLATHLEGKGAECMTGAFEHRTAHACYHPVVCLT